MGAEGVFFAFWAAGDNLKILLGQAHVDKAD